MTATPEQLRSLRRKHQLTQVLAARMVHASRRAWQTWESEGKEHRNMPAAKWELFNHKLEQIK